MELARFFKAELTIGKGFDSFIKEACFACKRCINRLHVQLDAIVAAVDNMKDNYGNACKTYLAIEVHRVFTIILLLFSRISKEFILMNVVGSFIQAAEYAPATPQWV